MRLVKDFRDKIYRELYENILPFWMKYGIDTENGGFYGCISNDLAIDKEASKGTIQHSRFLWTYSALYRKYGHADFLMLAQHAYDFLVKYLWDQEYQGLYMTSDYKGNPLDDRKFIYAQAFAVYGLSEYYRATGDKEVLDRAITLFNIIELYSYDTENKGYYEAYNRNWTLADDFILGEHHLNEKKSMNNHLHILEGYTNLFRVWKDSELELKLRELVLVTVEHIIDPVNNHFKSFFDEKWNVKSGLFTFGHDIEGSWLLYEACEVLEDKELLSRVKGIAVGMAQACWEKGIAEDGSILYESDGQKIVDCDRIWWCQAEALVGFLNAYQLSGQEHFLKAAFNVWKYIEENIADRKNGEWFWGIDSKGKPMNKEKAGLWKTTYHNVRACLEAMKRLETIKLTGEKHDEQ